MTTPTDTQPKTVELPALTDRALLEDLVRATKSGFAELRGNVDVLIADGQRTNQRLTRVETQIDDLDTRLGRTSQRVREPSSHDLETQAALAAETKARVALATEVADIKTETKAQTVMLTTLTDGASRFFSKPIVRSIATMLGTAILTWLAAHGGVK